METERITAIVAMPNMHNMSGAHRLRSHQSFRIEDIAMAMKFYIANNNIIYK